VLLALLLDRAAEADLTAAAALCSCCSLTGPWLRSGAALLPVLAGVAVSLLWQELLLLLLVGAPEAAAFRWSMTPLVLRLLLLVVL
jgi:hypothetical protein